MGVSLLGPRHCWVFVRAVWHAGQGKAVGGMGRKVELGATDAFPSPPAESLLHILESYGPDQFAAALVGDSGELGPCIQLH